MLQPPPCSLPKLTSLKLFDPLYGVELMGLTMFLAPDAVPPADPDIVMERLILEGDVPSPVNPPPGCVFHPRCLYAKDRCQLEAPQLREVEPAHFVSCHFAEELSLRGIGI